MRANLRVCAKCEWIFKKSNSAMCPKCGFAHYSAFYVYDRIAYKYAKTQQPYIDRKMAEFLAELKKEVG